MKITAVVLTKNEEENLEKCLDSMKFADEILVVDDYSQDTTCEIAQKHGAKILKRHLNGDFSSQKNFALSKASEKWVLFVDADEVVSSKLRKEIAGLSSEVFNGYCVRRIDRWFGRKMRHGEWGEMKLLRLARKDYGRWRRKVHEYWDVKARKGVLGGKLFHYPNKTIEDFVSSLNSYSTLHAEENMKEGKKSSILKIILMPALKFFKNYVLKLGFMDGTHGFLYTLFMSTHSFLSWSKLYLKQNK